ncbi:MAG: hypothetical protein IJZ55_03755 [Lachnospiraceae bacterium]|nr:hypothetical protein [Lachnospiraceae bacterium]
MSFMICIIMHSYMFYIDTQGNAVDEEYREIAENCQDVIQELLARANSQWLLKE